MHGLILKREFSYRCAHLHRHVVAGLAASTGVSDVLLELLQTVQHRLSQQLAPSSRSSGTTFTWNGPQVLDTGVQPGQVTTDVLELKQNKK